MPAQFANLAGAATLTTREFQLTGRIIDDLIAHGATGVVHGAAGTGKTYAVQASLERLRRDGQDRHLGVGVAAVTLAFPSRPSMRLVADELLQALTGAAAPRSRNRFYLTAALVEHLSGPQRLIVIDEAQRLNGDCIELLRHLHDHPDTRFALLYVGGDGCWEVLSREPMLASRVFRRLPFKKLPRDQVPALMRTYHPIYRGDGRSVGGTDGGVDGGVDDALLLEVDDGYGHGTLRNWAAFTQTAAMLCAESGRDRLDNDVVANAYALLGGGLN
ncbi:ATP-binding protein [Actinomadura terrae]|uniref:ATP-binding protein n=1 Tax=Actinomadura terrae TaxID=604353 RepID=UPI001FA79210|nr:ATP-binding protein [Actinomadura terrae]